jgi:hypothetical protein
MLALEQIAGRLVITAEDFRDAADHARFAAAVEVARARLRRLVVAEVSEPGLAVAVGLRPEHPQSTRWH